MQSTHNLLLIAFTLICFSSCLPMPDKEVVDKQISIGDPIFTTIHNYTNSQNQDSIRSLLVHPNKYVREAAAQACGSIKSREFLPILRTALQDTSIEVRKAAIYSIGQIGDPSSERTLVQSFASQDTINGENTDYNQAVLDAIGKLGSLSSLENISSVQSYKDSDDALLLGQAKSIYNFALRDIYSEKGTERMNYLLNNIKLSDDVRSTAANYFYRAKTIDIEPYKFQIARLVKEDRSPAIRMACAAALAKTNSPQVLSVLMDQLRIEPDYRVKCNIIRAFSSYTYIDVIETVLELTEDENVNVASIAADYVIQKGNARDVSIYREYAEKDLPWQVKAKLYQAVVRHVPSRYLNTKSIVNNEITSLLAASANGYEQAAYVKALSEDVVNYKRLYELVSPSRSIPVKTALVEGLYNAVQSPKWKIAYNTRGRDRYAKGEIATMIEDLIKEGDAGQTAAAATMLSDASIGFAQLNVDYTYLDSIKNQLDLPAELETYNLVTDAINVLLDTTVNKAVSANVKEINWDLLSNVGDTTIATLKTTKGDINIQLMPSLAPGTVSNFIDLAQQNYYDDKVFHRVVPNFVAQGGCPRGDGYGSSDYTIRSETPPVSFDRGGMVGMASAGPHTESCQFFVTHSPTMHLDGKYTLFGKVVGGMDIVHALQIGDKIEDLVIE